MGKGVDKNLKMEPFSSDPIFIYKETTYFHRGPLFVKLHSNPTKIQLVGVGVEFVFPLEEGRKEGFSRECDSTCLKFLAGVWKVFGNCLEGVGQVSRGGVKCV